MWKHRSLEELEKATAKMMERKEMKLVLLELFFLFSDYFESKM
jgi:hypothetical protein